MYDVMFVKKIISMVFPLMIELISLKLTGRCGLLLLQIKNRYRSTNFATLNCHSITFSGLVFIDCGSAV